MAQKKKIIYVARDIERALGMALSADYAVVTNRTPYAETIQKRYPDFVHLAEDGGMSEKSPALLDTADLLKSDIVRKLMDDPQAVLVVFKNNLAIEAIAKENGWALLNPPAVLAEKVENKITQVEWLGNLAKKYLPPFIISATKDLIWKKEPLVVQWAHGHSGDGTIVVNSADELRALAEKFPDRPARASTFVRGPSFTTNIITTVDAVLVGNISYQITGLPLFTDNPFTTVGNDWGLTHSLLSGSEISAIETMAGEISEKMRTNGWRGLFGIDIMRDDERGGIFLIEVNARQPASAVFESFLQEENRRQGLTGLTTFEAHIRALLGERVGGEIIPVNDGAQIIQRVTKKTRGITDDALSSLELAGYRAIPYLDTEYNSDLLRIQSLRGIMETHGRLNKQGKKIDDILNP